MNKIDSNLLCPSCHGQLAPQVLACEGCHIKVEGPFQLNEFAQLSPEDLHFLRIFLRCEGKVREMEPALGLSYPTIRTRLTQLKNKIAGTTEEPAGTKSEKNSPETSHEILARLESGKISFDEAMSQIKELRSRNERS